MQMPPPHVEATVEPSTKLGLRAQWELNRDKQRAEQLVESEIKCKAEAASGLDLDQRLLAIQEEFEISWQISLQTVELKLEAAENKFLQEERKVEEALKELMLLVAPRECSQVGTKTEGAEMIHEEVERRTEESVMRQREVERRTGESEIKQLDTERRVEEAQKRLQREERRAEKAMKNRSAEEKRAKVAERRRFEEEMKAEEAVRMRVAEEKRAKEAERRRLEEDMKAEEASRMRLVEEEKVEQVARKRLEEERKAEEAERRRQRTQSTAKEAERRAKEAERKAAEAERKAQEAKRSSEESKRKVLEAERRIEEAQRRHEEQRKSEEAVRKQDGIVGSSQISAVLPQRELAIHLGLETTRLGYITESGFDLIRSVDNCLYFENDGETVRLFGPVEAEYNWPSQLPFRQYLLNDTLSMPHVGKFRNGEATVRLEDILSLFLANLKMKAELKLKTEFRSCTIAVPQCLNELQRTCVKDSARIAGFAKVTLINDTNAIAVACMFERPESIKRNITVVNTTEDLLDVASFDVQNGLIRCHDISGMFYLRGTTIWNTLQRNSFFTTDASELISSQNSQEKLLNRVFSQQELKINPNAYSTVYFVTESGEISELCRREILGNYAHDYIPVDDYCVLRGASYVAALNEPEFDVVKKHWSQISRGRNMDAGLKEFMDKVTELKQKPSCNISNGKPLTEAELMERSGRFQNRGATVIQTRILAILANIMKIEKGLQGSALDVDVRNQVRAQLGNYYEQIVTSDVTLHHVEHVGSEVKSLMVNLEPSLADYAALIVGILIT